MRIASKRQMYTALKRGDFGNVVRHWDSLADMVADPFNGLVGCRCLQTNRPWSLYCLPKPKLLSELTKIHSNGAGFEFYESPPDDYRRIQGELCRGPWGLHFRYTFAPGAMRIALQTEEHNIQGLQADMLLRAYTDSGCYDWLMELLNTYDGHVVEFTSYAKPVGVLRQPYLIWEVRDY